MSAQGFHGRALFVVAAITACLSIGVGPSPGQSTNAPPADRAGSPPPSGPDYERTLARLDAVMEQHFRREPIAEARASINDSIDRYNQRYDRQRAKFELEQTELKRRADAIDRLKEQIEGMDKELSAPGRDDHPTRDATLTRRNDLVEKHNAACEKHNADDRALRDAVRRFQADADRQKEAIDAAEQRFQKESRDREHWEETRQDLAFFVEVNRLYAELVRKRQTGGASPGLDGGIARLRALKAELGQWAVKQQDHKAEGLILVRLRIHGPAGAEDCIMVVDTGAQTVTVDPNLIAALGMTDRLGDEVQTAVAGGLTAKGRELVLPKITVAGQDALEVRATSLEVSTVGVDGLLGQSFLSRFSYRIDKDDPRKLILESRRAKPSR